MDDTPRNEKEALVAINVTKPRATSQNLERDAKILAELKKGTPANDIAKRFKMSATRVYRIRQEAGGGNGGSTKKAAKRSKATAKKAAKPAAAAAKANGNGKTNGNGNGHK